ncbi:MAG: hypothetical protein CBC05_03615 [Crocinitomicaceae bacterium TMED45]|nr:MAG: hypothetical protein CBC05_03615 [Crocinitomicaceae bacterium TMED45]
MSDSISPTSLDALPWSEPRVCVVGDVMVDAYMWGHVHRISPEAPVPVVEVSRKEQRVGGAANVVKNLAALGAEVDLISVVGDDQAGRDLTSLLATMCTPHLSLDPSRPTTVKTRVISGGHHVVRVDEESTAEVSSEVSQEALHALNTLLNGDLKPDVVILEDYDKGLMTESFVGQIIEACCHADVPVTVDPKLKRFSAYRKVDLFKPNLKELNEGLGLTPPVRPSDRDGMSHAVEALMAQLGCERVFVTLGEHGSWIHAPNEDVHHVHIPALPRKVVDVSGAGDTVIAVASLMLASEANAVDVAAVANLAGGWVCERLGVVPITREALETELPRLRRTIISTH